MLCKEREISHMKADQYKAQMRAMYNRWVKIHRFKKGDLVLRRADTEKHREIGTKLGRAILCCEST